MTPILQRQALYASLASTLAALSFLLGSPAAQAAVGGKLYFMTCGSMLATTFQALPSPPRDQQVLVGVICKACAGNTTGPQSVSEKMTKLQAIVAKLKAQALRNATAGEAVRVVLIGDTESVADYQGIPGVDVVPKTSTACDYNTLMRVNVIGGEVKGFAMQPTSNTSIAGGAPQPGVKSNARNESSRAEEIDDNPGALQSERIGGRVSSDTPPAPAKTDSSYGNF